MIELTVKTLDSQNHSFSVPDDTTVKQLKERIAESINFPIDSQRLIYCGRVLQDEKTLNEYDVNGKVIHLVQRPPPQASRPNGNQPSNRTGVGQQRRTTHAFRHPRVDANAMYLGAMAFPADLMDAQGIQAPPSSNILSTSRVSLARSMLARASNVLNRLENPRTSQEEEPETPPGETENSSSTNATSVASGDSTAVGNGSQTLPTALARATEAATAAAIAAAVSAAHAADNNGSEQLPSDTGTQDAAMHDSTNISPEIAVGNNESVSETSTNDTSSRTQNVTNGSSVASSDAVTVSGSQALPTALARATEAATAAAIAAAVSAAHAAGMPNITIVRGGGGGSGANADQQQDNTVNGARDTPMQDASTSDSTNGSGQSASGASSTEEASNRTHEAMRTTVMAELYASMARIQQRLQPFTLQYQRLMNEDPTFADDSLAEESQRIFNGVSEVFHNLSHAYHAMSDIMCDFTRPPPRSLRCRPVLIQHSAVLQAGIPIQAQINVMTNRGSEARGRQTSSSQTPANTVANSNSSSANPAAAGDVPEHSNDSVTSSADANTTPSVSVSSAEQTPTSAQQQGQEGGNVPQPTFHITPGNVEFFMEVGPGSITIDSLEATVVTNSGSGSGSNGGSDVNGSGAFPWGAAPPPEFIQNIVHALGGHMMGRAGATQSNGNVAGAAAAGSGAAPAAGNGGQNSQARGNTATHPTTATQTRSTSRPHVHLAPAAVQSLSSNYFDPFLPCNSHHIRSRRRGTSQAATQLTPQQQQLPSQSQQQNASTATNAQQPVPSTPATATSRQQEVTSQPPVTAANTPSADRASSSQQDQRQSQAPTFPPGFLEMFQNIAANSQWSMANQFAAVPGMLQMLESFPGFSDNTMFSRYFTGSLADMVQSFPNHSYVEGESIFSDFLMTMARNMTLNDVALLSLGNVTVLSRMRPQLQEFVSQKVMKGEAPTEENISVAVNGLLKELRPHLKPLADARVRDEVDLVLSVNQYHQMRLPELIRLIMADGSDDGFGRRIVLWFSKYLREVTAILRHCCVDDAEGLERIMKTYVRQMMSGVPPDIQEWTVTSCMTQLRNYIARQTVTTEEIQSFIVYRIASSASIINRSNCVVHALQALATANDVPEPMETDSSISALNNTDVVDNQNEIKRELDDAHSPTNLVMDTDNLPDVVLGSEPWHNVLPSEWVPIITRDTQRQRKQNSQAPFSDAYLAGMPSKRRKIVASSKPQGTTNQIITDGVRQAVRTSGIRQASGMEVAGEDLELQAAYREQMKESFQDNVGSSSDVSGERFPNTTKYFQK